MRQVRGFTLVELVVTVVILAIVIMFAIPSFNTLMNRISTNSSRDKILTAFHYARSEAISQQAEVTICASADGANCSATSNWTSGWIVFLDDNGNQTVDTGDNVLSVWQNELVHGATLEEDNNKVATTFDANGTIGIPLVLTLEPFTNCGVTEARVFTLSPVGRMAVTEGDC
ncbi:MAG: GspH/FimT family pseudopilin [Reinekea sp.]